MKRAFGVTPSDATPPSAEDGLKKWEPAVPVKKSITPDAVICLCCGEGFKALKRHLMTEHKLDPAQYRAAFHLKADHPLVAPNYAAKRSELAKSLGLGRKPKAAAEALSKRRGPKPKIARATAA